MRIESMITTPVGRIVGASAISRLPLGSSLMVSLLFHALLLFSASVLIGRAHPLRNDLISISLIDAPQAETERLRDAPKAPAPRETKTSKPPAVAERGVEKPEREISPTAAPLQKEKTRPVETAPAPRAEDGAYGASPGASSGGGTGAATLVGKDEAGSVPAGNGGGGAMTAALGKGIGAPVAVLRTNRQAKPLRTAQPAYPPMALRMGLEGDVTLKIEVDAEGQVTKAAVLKSAGAAFDEAALKAVKQSRFEPAQHDGQTVLAEFTFIYRFRLTR